MVLGSIRRGGLEGGEESLDLFGGKIKFAAELWRADAELILVNQVYVRHFPRGLFCCRTGSNAYHASARNT